MRTGKSMAGWLLSVFFGLGLVNLVWSQQVLNFDDCCNNSQDATAFALAYGSPLSSFVMFGKTLLDLIGGSNRVITQPMLSTPNQRLVVKPNVDTLYSIVFVDLSHNDVIITVPPITDGRFWDFPFYDLFGNQFATVSITSNDVAGQYLLRRADDVGLAPGLVRTPVTAENIPKYAGIVNYPTNHGTLLVRILVRDNTTEEMQKLRQYQYGVKATPVNRTTSNPLLTQAPELTPDILDVSMYDTPEEQTMQLLARLGPYNQPSVPSDRYRVGSILGQAGLVNNLYQPPTNIDLTSAQQTANASINAFVRNTTNIILLNNGWLIQKPDLSGNFGTAYANRAYIASIGYLQLNPQEALYPTYLANAVGTETKLAQNKALLFTFEGGRPPIASSGFWSLTVYGGDNFLIANPLNRYEIGDRSNITFLDGAPVYVGGAEGDKGADQGDGRAGQPFQVLLQAQDVAPPMNWTGNWLPGPKGSGEIVYTLRWYAPTPALTDGSYKYPRVEMVDAIRA